MATECKLTEKQVAVVNDMFTTDADEQSLLAKHDVPIDTYHEWQSDGFYCYKFNCRLFSFNIQVEMMFARRAPQAAAKVISLINCPNPYIALKACREVINVHILKDDTDITQTEEPDNFDPENPPFSQEAGAKMLEILAEDRMKRRNDRINAKQTQSQTTTNEQ